MLHERDKQLETLLSIVDEAVIVTDADKRVSFMNRRAEALLGISSDRAAGRPLSEILVVSNGEPPLRLVRPGLEPVPVELHESPIGAGPGGPSGYVVVGRDLSERLRAQAAHDRELTERSARVAAEREQERARLKEEITLVLGDLTDSADQTAALRRVSESIARTLGSCCVIHVADPPPEARFVAPAHTSQAALAERCVASFWPMVDHSRGAYAVLKTGRAELVSSVVDDASRPRSGGDEFLRSLLRLGVSSYVCVPLRARHRIIGTLGVLALEDDARHYDASDLIFVQQLGDRIALALENARLFREAQASRARAERLYRAERQARAEAEALLRIAEALSVAGLDLDAIVQRVTDEATALVGAEFGALFYNVTDPAGGSYRLYTLSGAPREAFEKLGHPRNTPIFGPTFRGEGTVRIDDVHDDPRYGREPPHYGMPKGHLPVRSYLAVPVISRAGTVIGGLFFGHRDPGRFTDQHERMAKALAAQAAVAIDNARLFQRTREAEAYQSQLVQKLERSVRLSEMFVGILGHDLRNPLSGIIAAASLLGHRADSESIARPAARILNSAERMSRMIDQILDFSSVRLGRGIPLHPKRVDLAGLSKLVLGELKGAAPTLTVHLDVLGNPTGTWDEDRLAQLLSNLTGNALQHRRRGTPVHVTIDGSHPDRVTLVVENEGTIPEGVLPVVFDPLRGGDRRREGSSGLGLGLYISQQIVVAHGGEIRVESRPEEGRTRFIVTLPRIPSGPRAPVFSERS